MRTKMFYAIAIAICGAVGMNSCTKDYDDESDGNRQYHQADGYCL